MYIIKLTTYSVLGSKCHVVVSLKRSTDPAGASTTIFKIIQKKVCIACVETFVCWTYSGGLAEVLQ